MNPFKKDLFDRYALLPMQEEHLRDVEAIERSSYSNPWPADAFRHEVEENAFSRPRVAVTTDEPRRVAGYCVFWIVFDQINIQNVAVHPRHRRLGLARLLIRRALDEGRDRGAKSALLEVRASNVAARKLYASLGFHPAGARRNYYSRPPEDAVLLSATLER